MSNDHMAIPPEQRSWAIIAHMSGLAGYVVPFAGVIAPILIMMMKSDTPIVSAIAKQALFLNVAAFLSGFVVFFLVLTILLIPVAIILGAVVGISVILLPIIGAVQAADGNYFRYPLVGQTPS
jgi:uncharacterized Tic20 family protein